MSTETLYPASKKIIIAGKDFEVKKLPFKKHMQVAQLALSLNFDKPELIAISADKIIEILAIALGADKVFLEENLGIEETAAVLKDVLEMNKAPFKKPQDPGSIPEKK